MAMPTRAERPLSPHLQIYRPMLTTAMSIFHRITGVALYLGTILLVIWLVAAAMGPATFETAQWFFGSIVGRLILLGYTWALLHHMLGGIRHFIWDSGYGFEAPTREYLAQATIGGSLVLTVVVWAAALFLR